MTYKYIVFGLVTSKLCFNFQPQGRDDFGQGNASAKFVSKEVFYDLVSQLGRRTRKDIGHQKNVFVLDCEFNGRDCREQYVH